MIPSEYRDITYLILKVLNRPLKWSTARLWTPTGFKNTSRQSWTFGKNLDFSTTEVFFERSSYALNFYPTKSRFRIPNPDFVYQIQILYTKSRFRIPNSDFVYEFGIQNLDLVYENWIWYTKSGFGIRNLDLVG